MTDWGIFQGTGQPNPDPDIVLKRPEAPQWRRFSDDLNVSAANKQKRGSTFQTPPEAVEMVNAALYLRRPLLVTGKPGAGKTSLAYALALELHLGEVLTWPIATHTTLKDGLYQYDAIGRLQETQRRKDDDQSLNELEPTEIGDYIQLGPLGTALLPCDRPRILLIDEIDKSNIDLPNDLLHIFEEGVFEIPELTRLKTNKPITVQTAYSNDDSATEASIVRGRVQCREFPIVILTSNGEKEFPSPFLRRCIRLGMVEPSEEQLTQIVQAHLGEEMTRSVEELIASFLERRNDVQKQGDLATDQLLNAAYLISGELSPQGEERKRIVDKLLEYLTSSI